MAAGALLKGVSDPASGVAVVNTQVETQSSEVVAAVGFSQEQSEPCRQNGDLHTLLPKISRAITIFMISVEPSICLHMRNWL